VTFTNSSFLADKEGGPFGVKIFFGPKSFFWGREHFFNLVPTLNFEFQKNFTMTLIPVGASQN